MYYHDKSAIHIVDKNEDGKLKTLSNKTYKKT
jgi:hypothetical protein